MLPETEGEPNIRRHKFLSGYSLDLRVLVQKVRRIWFQGTPPWVDLGVRPSLMKPKRA